MKEAKVHFNAIEISKTQNVRTCLTLYCGRATIVAQPVVVEDDESLTHFVQILYEAYT